MAISLRLSRKLEEALALAARGAGISKSEFVRRCLEQRLEGERRPSFYEAGKDLFGRYSSGRNELARNSKRIVKEIIRAKNRRS
jgi:RHH-type transcriptional regulator, rel operon repressor / antitoxin RelB